LVLALWVCFVEKSKKDLIIIHSQKPPAAGLKTVTGGF
jgi:hypothetical protein